MLSFALPECRWHLEVVYALTKQVSNPKLRSYTVREEWLVAVTELKRLLQAYAGQYRSACMCSAALERLAYSCCYK